MQLLMQSIYQRSVALVGQNRVEPAPDILPALSHVNEAEQVRGVESQVDVCTSYPPERLYGICRCRRHLLVRIGDGCFRQRLPHAVHVAELPCYRLSGAAKLFGNALDVHG